MLGTGVVKEEMNKHIPYSLFSFFKFLKVSNVLVFCTRLNPLPQRKQIRNTKTDGGRTDTK